MIKRLIKSIRQYERAAILSPVFISFEVIIEVIIPLLIANLIDFGIDVGNMNNILKYGIALVVSCAFSLLFGVLSGKYAAIASSGFGANLRHDLFHKIQDFSFTNIDKFSGSSLVTRLTTDVSYVQNAFQMIIRIAVRAPVMLVFSLIMAFSIDAKLSLIFFSTLPVLGIGLYLIMSKAHPTFERVFRTFDKLNKVVQENLRGIRVVKSFVREEHEKEKFNTVAKEIYSDFSKAEKLIAFNAPLMQFCMYACMLMISWFGARMIVGGTLSTGHLMSLITYTMQMLSSLMMVSMVFVMITISRASAERINEILIEESDIVSPEDPIFEVSDGSVSFENVSFGYSKNTDRLCLKNIDLYIPSGATVGIIGVTGSAKSSLVQLIPRLYDVTSGTLKVGGVDVRSYDIKSLRDKVSMVLQKNVLFSGTINENLRWGNADATDEEIRNACILAQADDFINEFPGKYDTYIEQGGSNVSGGQRQRLCIARALLKNPKIIIFDDSTSAVDTRTDAMIRKSLRDSIPSVTKIIISQRIASVEDADMIIVMENGRIEAVGTHDELLKSSKQYIEVYESQMKGVCEDE